MPCSTAADTDPERQPLLPNDTNPNSAQMPTVQRGRFWRRARTVLKGSASTITFRYPNETIVWTPCGVLEGKLVECSSVVAPMDHFNLMKERFPLVGFDPRGDGASRHLAVCFVGGPERDIRRWSGYLPASLPGAFSRIPPGTWSAMAATS
ncbi:hypothetical protein V2A60_009073 [Cordyceps javanica]